MQWKRLDRDSSLRVIDSVSAGSDMPMFNISTSEVTMARLSFYQEYALFKITNFVSVPTYSFEYLGDGVFFEYLDGTKNPILTVNDKGKFVINDNNVIDYLSFYYDRAKSEDPDIDDITIIINPHDMPLLDSLDPMAYAAVMRNYKPAHVTQNSNGGFTVETEIYTEGMVMRATIEVTGRGRVNMRDQKMIMNEVLDSGTSEALV